MRYRKMTLEEGEEEGGNRTLEPDDDKEYVPGRGEAFALGITSGWTSTSKVMPFVLIAIILILAFVCN
jgi:hypothetical protein